MSDDKMKPGFCQKILPLTYNNSLSYYENLCQIIDYVNNKIDSINASFLEEAKAYTDSKFDSLSASITELTASINEQITTLNAKINTNSASIKDITQTIENLQVDFSNQIANLYNLIMQNKLKTDSNLIELKNWVIDYIETHTGDVDLYVINPVTQTVDTIQNTLDMMYSNLNAGALSAEEYDGLQLTSQEYAEYNLTAFQYDTRARYYLFTLLYLRMRNPFTGLIDTYANVINALANLHRDALTSIEYDNLELTSANYDSKGITSYKYDWHGATSLA